MQNNTQQDIVNQPAYEEDDEPFSWGAFQLQESLKRSYGYWSTYEDMHSFESWPQRDNVVRATVRHALSRLEWMLDEARMQISDLFTRREFAMLAQFYQGSFAATKSGNEFAADMCLELDIDIENFEDSEHADFIKRLVNLTAAQCAALADALEVLLARRELLAADLSVGIAIKAE